MRERSPVISAEREQQRHDLKTTGISQFQFTGVPPTPATGPQHNTPATTWLTVMLGSW